MHSIYHIVSQEEKMAIFNHNIVVKNTFFDLDDENESEPHLSRHLGSSVIWGHLLAIPLLLASECLSIKIHQRGGAVETGCSDLYAVMYYCYIILPPSTALPSDCTPL